MRVEEAVMNKFVTMYMNTRLCKEIASQTNQQQFQDALFYVCVCLTRLLSLNNLKNQKFFAQRRLNWN